MKISKLFHWLYGVVMLLPIFAIGVTCGYAMFNKNAKDSYYGENINEEISEITSFSDVNKNTLYTIYTNEITRPFNPGYQVNFVCRNINVNGVDYLDYNQVTIGRESSGQERYIIQLRGTNLSTQYFNFGANDYIIKFYYESLLQNDFFIPLNYISFNKDSFVSEVFYYSVERVTESQYFNWAYSSFLTAPFVYIVSLFSMPTNSPVVMLMSYWLAISIIWLCFDLVMYVPLLVHRWLDKGAIE